eukprot:TRINITY_DN5613_c0_g1_i1.p1 TRINITY_DN5613_c0_g1~~TRINITY_DN5613_c0_g1_i1.p1  ORF type:complete len:507 (+),score=125.70 TRINITY_DN5613_c0_g1_i1:98-1618(+)
MATCVALAAVAAVAGVGVHAPRSGATCGPVARRVDCGWAGISEDMCEARGCCYNKTDTESVDCFFSTTGVPIRKVHVIQSNHFDAGYTSTTTDVINTYFKTYFPRAASVGEELSKNATGPQLRWMTQSYLVSLYLDCPTGAGLACPSDAEVATFRKAVQSGWITWHAFPTNAELAAMHPGMVRRGLNVTHTLDTAFGLPPKKVLSQRDVPGLPRSSIPLITDAGVTTYSIGGNERCNPPNVPQAFLWQDGDGAYSNYNLPDGASAPSQKELLVFWHAYGYGQVSSEGRWAPVSTNLRENPETPRLELPLLDEALVYAWRGDNQGPATSAAEVAGLWDTVAGWYPDAEIVASDLETFSEVVLAAGDKVLGSLPTVTADLSDTWIMGVQSDPWKEARARAFGRAQGLCEAAADCPKDTRYLNATRLAQKNGEHTWGLHLSSMGKWQSKGWSNAEFHSTLAKGDKSFTACQASWSEQRDMGIATPLPQRNTPGSEERRTHVGSALVFHG